MKTYGGRQLSQPLVYTCKHTHTHMHAHPVYTCACTRTHAQICSQAHLKHQHSSPSTGLLIFSSEHVCSCSFPSYIQQLLTSTCSAEKPQIYSFENCYVYLCVCVDCERERHGAYVGSQETSEIQFSPSVCLDD